MAIAVVAAALAATRAFATDYWVKNGGDDGASGTSLAAAWATLGHAANAVGPGDTVHVADGSYEGFYLTTSGTASAPIVFQAEGSDVRITSDNGTTPDGINLEGASWVVIEGFHVDSRTRAGIRAVSGAHVTVRNCLLGFNGRWGILTGFVDDFVAEGNVAHHSVAEHGIYVSNSADRPIVRNNLVYSNHANGLHFNGDASLGGDGLIEDAVVEGNIIWDNGRGGGSGINMDGSVRGVIRNNLLYDNHSSGISLYRIDAATGAKDNLVVNNTIIQPSDGRWCVNIGSGSTGNTVRNNILWTSHSFRGVIVIDASSRPGFSSDHNSLLDRFSADGDATILDLGEWQALGYDLHSFVATPAQHFVAPGSDFHLLVSSPAVDAGVSTGAPSADLEGKPRPVGAAVDLGAYELQLPDCGDGDPDPGEQCGEPGLACDACSTCSQCVCLPKPASCGDGVVCGAEECESSADCAAGQSCQGCACVNALACESGVAARKPTLKLTATPYAFKLTGEAVIPKPWTGVDPAANGVRVVVDAAIGPASIDVTIPGGPLWRTNAARTRWVYADRSGATGGVKRIVVIDRSAVESGLVRWRVVGRRDAGVLPDATQTRSAVVLGAPDECALTLWNGPAGDSPRCVVTPARLTCG
ncbi:MAG TPA: right-handed parallel beta-helix repeat-containing protein [Candidatus Binatia bacterium]|nr:right-handed parallel beta-helix repeat-containing protein [Candidatus Binatia bacterium]